ncbi:transposase [Streptomyces sp. 2A115]|uniref:transposase n=1 Tax=Streptomyces sp. 2A115 TaxID=3457439 RepID=UPI003FD22EA7
MGSKYTKRYTEEFKRDAIALVDSSGKTVTAVARELGISSESLRGWYRKAKAEQGEGTPDELSSAEREELKRLRRENREQQQPHPAPLGGPTIRGAHHVPQNNVGKRSVTFALWTRSEVLITGLSSGYERG